MVTSTIYQISSRIRFHLHVALLLEYREEAMIKEPRQFSTDSEDSLWFVNPKVKEVDILSVNFMSKFQALFHWSNNKSKV